MSEYSNKFAILMRESRLTEYCKEGKPRVIRMPPGVLIKTSKYTPNNIQKNRDCLVHLVDFDVKETINDRLYVCAVDRLKKVNKNLWPYIISIPDEIRRYRLFGNTKLCQWLLSLKINDIVGVHGNLIDGGGNNHYVCIIRYIGPVEEFSPVGYVFGLELLNLYSGNSPQSEDIPYSIKYMGCDPNLSIFAFADALCEVTEEVNKKFSASKFIADTLRQIVGPTPCLSDFGEKRAKEPTSKFYDDSQVVAPQQIQTFTPATKTNDGISMGKEEFTQVVDKYATKLTGEPSAKSQTLTGILKQTAAASTSFGPKERATTNTSKPIKSSTIMSLADRDILVIDESDIRECEKNEPEVILVKQPPPQQKDLVEILGKDWSEQAGDVGAALNRSRKNQRKASLKHENDNQTKMENAKAQGFNTADKEKNANITEKDKHLTSQQDQAVLLNEAINNIEYPPIESWDEVPDTDLGVGSLVEVSAPDVPGCLYGVIRWVNVPPGEANVMVGVELEEEQTDARLKATDGSYNGIQLFQCNERRAIYVAPERCHKDRRFADSGHAEQASASYQRSDSVVFGDKDCPTVPGTVAPLKVGSLDELKELCGKFKGIQGHHNSCYLDATLFAMYTFTSVFDSILFRPPTREDIPLYAEVQKVLREEIVNPLRKNVFVRADRVLKLRRFMDRLSSVSGLMCDEKDPEEFLNSLLAQIMRAEPFLKLSSGQDSYFYQLFVEKDERLTFPSVQQLFDQSFHSSDIKLKEVPSCLIIQMPRFGKDFKMYPRILPTQVLDITDIIEDAPRQCTICGKLAEYECGNCFGILPSEGGLDGTAFCSKCLETTHMHAKRANHTFKKLKVPQDFRVMSEHMNVPRVYMELFAVVCIETSHYVSFVKAGSGPDAPWCFFDSMADRKGEQNGYNIPEMMPVPDLPHWLSEDGSLEINESSSNDKHLSEHAKRLFCDAYMCMYQSTDVMMYR